MIGQWLGGRSQRKSSMSRVEAVGLGRSGNTLRGVGGRPGGLGCGINEQDASRLVPLNRDKILLSGFLYPMSSMAWSPGQQPHPTLGCNGEGGLGTWKA